MSSYNSSDQYSLPNAIIVKYDSLGKFLWSKTFLSEYETSPVKIEVNNNNEAIMLTTLGAYPYLTHFDESGNILWSRKLTYYPPWLGYPIRYHRAVDFTIDESDSIYLCGYYEEGIYFSANDSLYSPSGSIFLVKYTPTGTVDWVRSIENPNQTTLFPIKLFQRSESVGIVVLNHIPDVPFEINGFPVSQYIFATEFAKDGSSQMAYDLYTANSTIMDVVLDRDGNLYLMGGLRANTVFQYENILIQSPVEKWFLIKFNQDKILWAQFHGNIGNGMDLEIDNAGDIFWSGAWGRTASIFGETMVADEKGDALVSKLSSKSIYFETDSKCSDIPISFEFNHFDFTYASTVQDFKVVIDSVNYTELNFSHSFDNGGEKTLKLSLVDNLNRFYSRNFNINIFELKPEIYFQNGTIYSNALPGVTAYTWFKDKQIFTTTSPSFLTVEDAGFYYLEIETENGCFFNSNELSIEIDELVTSIEDRKISQVLVWPNPASDVLYIDSWDSSVDITIYSLDGKSLMKKTSSGQIQIDVSGLQQGIYILRTNTKNGTHHSRIVLTTQ